MPFYNNPDFLRLPPGLAGVFAEDRRQSFFALPQWYDLMARSGVEAGTGIRVYTDESPNSSAALLLQEAVGTQPLSLLSLANFYGVEHGPICAANADFDRALSAILGEILADRPRWDCIRLLELDPSEDSYNALVRALRRAGFLVECTQGTGTWFETTGGMSFED